MALRSGIHVYSDELHKSLLLDSGPAEGYTAAEARRTRASPSRATKASPARHHDKTYDISRKSGLVRGATASSETLAEGRQVRGIVVDLVSSPFPPHLGRTLTQSPQSRAERQYEAFWQKQVRAREAVGRDPAPVSPRP